jgi:hypothetical protein
MVKIVPKAGHFLAREFVDLFVAWKSGIANGRGRGVAKQS